MQGTLYICDSKFIQLTRPLSVTAGKGILTSAFATGILGFITAILFLFCTPDLDTFFALDAPQPFVQVYALALGKRASIFMTIIAIIGLVLVSLNILLTYWMFTNAYRTRACPLWLLPG